MTSDLPHGTSARPEDIGAITDLMRWFPALLQIVSANATGDVELVTQRSLSQYRPTLLSSPEIFEAKRRALISADQVQGTLARLGYSDGAQAMLSRLSDVQLASGEVLELYRRKTIDRQTAETNLSHLGYHPNNIEALLSLIYHVPTAQAVISFAVREVYNPDIAERFGQFQDFPESGLPDLD